MSLEQRTALEIFNNFLKEEIDNCKDYESLKIIIRKNRKDERLNVRQKRRYEYYAQNRIKDLKKYGI